MKKLCTILALIACSGAQAFENLPVNNLDWIHESIVCQRESKEWLNQFHPSTLCQQLYQYGLKRLREIEQEKTK